MEFKLKKKKLAGGAVCSIYATCAETGDKDIFIYQFDEKQQPQTDYIYVRYGEEALGKIRASAEKVFPGCKVIVNERVYNHLTKDMYDKDTDLAGYLADNFFHISVYVPQLPGTDEEFAEKYTDLRLALIENGVDYSELMLGCPEDFGAVVPPDHIICTNEEQYEGSSGSKYTYSAYCPNNISSGVNKGASGNSRFDDYVITKDGQKVGVGRPNAE